MRKFRRSRDGVTAIEFALIAPVFFVLVLGTMEIGISFLVHRMADNAVLEASRKIKTGQALRDGFNETQFKAEICSSMPDFMCDVDRIVLEVSEFEFFSELDSIDDMLDDDGEIREDYNFQVGSAGSIILVRTIYRWPMVTSILGLSAADGGNYERYLYSTQVFRNEPFPYTADGGV
ncbi:TadE/TadG family type IV pilus assembly protein [Roseibium hamelinense]|nr:TadE/TadG family type IV pilus assembly protein [Roseibium hamelinense]